MSRDVDGCHRVPARCHNNQGLVCLITAPCKCTSRFIRLVAFVAMQTRKRDEIFSEILFWHFFSSSIRFFVVFPMPRKVSTLRYFSQFSLLQCRQGKGAIFSLTATFDVLMCSQRKVRGFLICFSVCCCCIN